MTTIEKTFTNLKSKVHVRPDTETDFIQYSYATDLVQSFIDSLVVVGLDRAKVWLDQLQVAVASEEGDATGVVEAWC